MIVAVPIVIDGLVFLGRLPLSLVIDPTFFASCVTAAERRSDYSHRPLRDEVAKRKKGR